jgi:hypothetical protein
MSDGSRGFDKPQEKLALELRDDHLEHLAREA